MSAVPATSPRVGVVTFPGSLDDRDALRAVATMGGEGVPLWHGDHDLRGVDAVVLPGGFSYGDYLRCGAIAGSRRSCSEIRAFAERGGPVLGICNGFQILCEAGLLPGALIRNASLRFVCRQVSLRVETSQTPVTGELVPGEVVEMPIKHGEGQYVATRRSAPAHRGRGPRRVPLRGRARRGDRRRRTPTARSTTSPGVRNDAGNVVGLMPHPEHAVDPDVGPTGGQPLFASLLARALERTGASA